MLTPAQIDVLRDQSRIPVPQNPTVGVAALAIAVMGGYMSCPPTSRRQTARKFRKRQRELRGAAGRL
ncbi:MAG: hypothetical protein MUF54_16840 [Polyangiaceae bacterium]|nr:hypothetical protein [Polyangiaceae bacterium]